MRRAVVGLGLLLLLAAVVGLGTPSGAQTAPTISVSPKCSAVGVAVTLTITGSNFPTGQKGTLTFDQGGAQQISGSWSTTSTSSSWSQTLTVTPQQNRDYVISANVSGTNVTTIFSAPCPSVTLDPTCFTPGQATQLTVSGFDFAPKNNAYAVYDPNGPDQQTRDRIPTDATGNWTSSSSPLNPTPFSVTPDNRTYSIHTYDLAGTTVDVRWSPCPPGTTTSTTTVTTAPTTTTTQPVITVTTLAKTTTTRPATTTTTIPPPTPGATLVVMPAIGKPGSVVLAHGSGFPPGPVVLVWTIGIGTTTATAGPDGTFSTQVLVFPRDRLGARALTATSGSTTASAALLVVPDSVKPSGREISQIISLSRRFLER